MADKQKQELECKAKALKNAETCPTCEQPISKEQFAELLEGFKKQRNKYISDIEKWRRDCEIQDGRRTKFSRTIGKWNDANRKEKSFLRDYISFTARFDHPGILNVDVKRLSDEICALESEQDVDWGRKVTDLSYQKEKLQTSIAQYNKTIGRIEEQERQCEQINELFLKLQKEYAETEREVECYGRLVKAFSSQGIPAMLMKNALMLLEQEACKILDVLSQGRMGISFESDVSKGVFDVMVTVDGNVRSYELCSGGEQFKVDLACRIALALMLLHKAGVKLDVLFIDEGSGVLDRDGRDCFVEALNYATRYFKQIVVISHITEIGECFSQRIVFPINEANDVD